MYNNRLYHRQFDASICPHYVGYRLCFCILNKRVRVSCFFLDLFDRYYARDSISHALFILTSPDLRGSTSRDCVVNIIKFNFVVSLVTFG